jgi:DNA-binding NarL/FixJ family response regulator
MKQWFALSAIGRDRPGIVADLAELIYECDCNLEDSSMTILGSEFAVLLLLTGDDKDIAERLSNACKRLEWEKRLTVFFRPLEAEPIPYAASHQARRYALQAVGIDKAGIVAKLSRCLADVPSLSVVGDSADTATALEVSEDLQPDVVLIDIGMAHGPPLARQIRQNMAGARVIALAVSDASTDAMSWAGAGVVGYITRDQAIEDLVTTVERAARGEVVCPHRVVASLLDGLAAQARDDAPWRDDRLERLSAREAEILTLIEAGMSNKEMARKLSISLSTVKNHVHSVLRKLEVPHRFDAARRRQPPATRIGSPEPDSVVGA